MEPPGFSNFNNEGRDIMDRQLSLSNFRNKTYDLLIIGGGIVGAGIARDAASRGMSVALVEKNDFAYGTSSRSSKLIHGGIRYLENKEFGLVFEALSEREKLYEIAPHLVHPLRFVLPVYKDSRVGMGLMSLGMWLYDILSLFQSPFHERLSPQKSLDHMPLLKSNGLEGAFIYSDAYMDDDRLVIETLRSACSFGADVANYVEALDWSHEVDKNGTLIYHQIKVKNLEPANDFDKAKSNFQIKAKHVVSCVGAWTDSVAPHFDPHWKKQLRPTKGIHITLKKDRLPLKDAVVMAVDKENRIVFGIPRHDMIIIGTTDTDFKGELDGVVATKDDIQYLLKIVGEYFPGAQLTEKDIIATYAGIRPLVDDGSKTEGKTSREHKIISNTKLGITFVMGGKYTTYRKMSQDVVETILKCFDIESKVKFCNSKTNEALNPLCTVDQLDKAKYLAQSWSQIFHLQLNEVSFLVERHGMEAEEILKFGKLNKLSMWEVELHHAVRNTMCLHLVDFFTRRTPLFLAEKNHGIELAEILALHMQNELNWSESQRNDEKNKLVDHIRHELAWQQQTF